MGNFRFAQGLQVVPLEAPAATTDDVESAAVALKNVHWVTFLVQVGSMTTATTNTITFTPYSATGQTTASGDTALPFWYRKSSAVGTDNWGDVTAVSAGSGIALTGADSNKLLIIDVDPDVVPALDSDAAYMYLDIDVGADGATDANYATSVIGVLEPRYAQAEIPSST